MTSRMFITIDGDDVGQKITKYYLTNDMDSLSGLNVKMAEVTNEISLYLKSVGFTIIFCGADGVACFADTPAVSATDIFAVVSELGRGCATFSAGTGGTSRESYIALMAAKSHGKAQIFEYGGLT